MHEFALAPFLILPFFLAVTLSRQNVPEFTTPMRIVRVTLVLFLLLLVVFVLSIHIGPANIRTLSILSTIFQKWFGGVSAPPLPEETILLSIRLPRILFAGLVGGSLSVAGVVFQALLRNPLADPYILGISGGSAVGAITGIIIGASVLPLGIPGLAFLGALLTIFLVFGIALQKKDVQTNTLLLSGVIVNAFFTAVIMFLIATSSNVHLHSIFFWLMGDLGLVEKRDILLVAPFLIAGFLVIYACSRPLNLMVMGEDTAMHLGVPVRRIKILLFVVASLITAVTVSVSGTIGFVGLIIPHIVRMMLGPDHRILLPSCLLFGSAFMMAADTIARSIMAPNELPVGVITAICGAPYFIYLLRKKTV